MNKKPRPTRHVRRKCVLFISLVVAAVSFSQPAEAQTSKVGLTFLVDRVESGNSDQQAAALRQLADLAGQAREAIPAIDKAMNSPSCEVRIAAVGAFWAIEGESEEHLSILLEGLKDENSGNRSDAARLLGELASPAALQPLVERLGDQSAAVRYESALALGELGDKAIPALPKLVEVIQDHAAFRAVHATAITVAHGAGAALRKIGPAALESVKPLFANDDPRTRILAIWVIAGCGEKAMPHLDVLYKSLLDANRDVRLAAIAILGELRLADTETIPALTALLHDDDHRIRFWALKSLSRFGSKTSVVRADIIVCLRDKNPGVRAQAADALAELGSQAEGALPELERLRLDDESFGAGFGAFEDVSDHADRAVERIRAAIKSASVGGTADE